MKSFLRSLLYHTALVLAGVVIVLVGWAFQLETAGEVHTAFTVDQSLRFNDDDSAYLSRTPGSAGNFVSENDFS